ncbi:MAG: AAA family ATPase, partial [Lentimicrobiaceae bacterium]|nr:AAA family ATPase [Lentimicrobiaceae bacterium]
YSFNFSNRFELNQEVLSSLKKLSKLWEYSEHVFHFSWYGISAGESALLSLLSRLVPSSKYSVVLKENLWLVFDEPDLYLHPEWQREFFNDLHNYLPKLFPDKKIQLFLTSHSPFLVSDLPKQNIILLDKDDDKCCKIVTESKLDKTFGANIHTLLSDAFFMNKGLIGEFAKVKIFELMAEINKLNNPQLTTVEAFKKRIEIIGEPMIRQKLYELLMSKVLSDDKARKRAFHQSELDKLNHQNSEE